MSSTFEGWIPATAGLSVVPVVVEAPLVPTRFWESRGDSDCFFTLLIITGLPSREEPILPFSCRSLYMALPALLVLQWQPPPFYEYAGQDSIRGRLLLTEVLNFSCNQSIYLSGVVLHFYSRFLTVSGIFLRLFFPAHFDVFGVSLWSRAHCWCRHKFHRIIRNYGHQAACSR